MKFGSRAPEQIYNTHGKSQIYFKYLLKEHDKYI